MGESFPYRAYSLIINEYNSNMTLSVERPGPHGRPRPRERLDLNIGKMHKGDASLKG